MAEELKQTKIPRFESGSSATSSSVLTRIPKPSGFARPTAPAAVAAVSKEAVTLQSDTLPRKSFLCRFGAANKVKINGLPRILSKNPLKSTTSQIAASKFSAKNDENARAANETIELTKGTAMNITKPVIIDAKNTEDTCMDRSLTRSNTFVYETVDDTQAKLLSVTHNINAPQSNGTMSQAHKQQPQPQQQQTQLNKERTFKRSLSPIPGESMNSAKRKPLHVSGNRKVAPMNSTPRRSMSHSDSRNPSNLTFFGSVKSEDLSSVEHMQTFMFDNNTFEQSNNFAPDATVQLSRVANATMHGHRVFDLTQTVEQQQPNDIFYPENRTITTAHDVNAAEHGLANNDGDALHSNDENLGKTITVEKTQPIQIVGSGPMNADLLVAKKRFSLGLELPECTLDCSIELCDSSAATSAQDSSPLLNYKSQSYDMDESLGILTPDQMIEFLDTNATHAKIDLPNSLPVKIEAHGKCRLADQTPSPEELPLDPIEVKVTAAATSAADSSQLEDADMTLQPSSICDQDSVRLQSDTDSKADQMVKSNTSKVTNSFITSVTSIASLDNGYHADGEMSRPASRGAESPLRRVHNARQSKFHANGSSNSGGGGGGAAVLRRQDPMTDSDFFTESDADDIFQRRHVHIIDGHMYNGSEDIFIDEAHPPENDMESSGVYTDVEQHRSDNDNAPNSNSRNENESGETSPDSSSDTIKSSEYANDDKKSTPKIDLDNTTKTKTAAQQQQQQQAWTALPTHSTHSIPTMSSSSSATINDSVATCVCEKPYSMKSKGNSGVSSSGSSSKRASGGDLAQLVINSDASPSSTATATKTAATAANNEKKSSCKLHSIGRSTDSDNSKSASKAATPQFKSNGTPKVKRSSQNRKQCKSETSSHSNSGNSSSAGKRNETPKRESKSVGVRNRSSALLGVSKKLPGTKSPPIENGRHSENPNNNPATNSMTSDDHQTTVVTVHLRKTVPNKWDAVMNKIALNKAEVKTVKYSNVKSKVTSGIKRNSPSSKTFGGCDQQQQQPQSISDSGNSSLTSTKSSASPVVTRQSTHGISKRSIERDSSKDSHFSSGHDSTITPPGKVAKPTTPSSRSSARKRSSIQNGFSPNDTAKITAAETAAPAKCDSPTTKSAVLHKRFTLNNTTATAVAAAATTARSVSSSPISEKRSTITVTKKSSNKQHVNQTIIVPPVANSTLHAKEHGLHSQLSHPPIINNNNSSINNNNNNHSSTKSGTNPAKLTATVAATTTPVATAAVNGDHHHHQHQPPIASIHRNGRVSSEAAPAAKKAVAIPKVKSKSKSKSKSVDKTLTNGSLTENLIEFSIVDSIDGNQSSGGGDRSSALLSLASSPIPDKTVRNLQPTPTDLNVIQANKTIVALSILIQHLTTDLKAFETPSLRAALGTAKDNLLKSQQNLDTMRTKCTSLEEQMIAKEQFFTTNESVLKQTQCELEKIQSVLIDTEKSAKQQIQTLQYELAEINQQHADALKSCQMKADRRYNELEAQLQISRDRELELVDRLNECSVTENRLRDKVQASEQEFAQRLIAATARERELNEKVAQLMHQLKITEDTRYELDEKLKLAHAEKVVLRKRQHSGENCVPNGNSNMFVQSLTAGSSPMMLEEEVLSLRSVLEMKLTEISELRKQNQAMQSAQDELPKAQLKISILESRLEDLTIQLKTKVEEEQDLSTRNRSLQEMFNQEVKNRTRLALHNEELQWKLKQNSEKYTSTLSELSKSYQDPSLLSDFKSSLYAPISETSLDQDALQQQQLLQQQNSLSSPPSSPVVKGVVEKCDSVSYVLELNDDESAEAVASRVVKRAGSFRVNNFKERSPSFKRQLSLGGANALCQSASATSLLRQHSDSPVKCGGAAAKIQRNTRTRSYSLNASNEPKKGNCSPPVEVAPNDYMKWQRSMKTMATSSPLTTRSLHGAKNGQFNGGLVEIDDDEVRLDRPVSADGIEVELDGKTYLPNGAGGSSGSGSGGDEQQRNGHSSDLCRTMLTSQSSVNTLKKRQQKLKESAGEAMVSQHSEDDQSFGSDMDSAPTTSSSSSSSASSHSSAAASPSHSEPQAGSHKQHHRHLSLDEEAFMNKIVASLSTRSTPMEVSWSEDGDNEPYAQESSA